MSALPAQVTRYVRYTAAGTTSYGLLEGQTVRELRGDLFATPQPTGRTLRLDQVKLLAPVVPGKVIAVGLNYLTHLGERPAAAYRSTTGWRPSRMTIASPASTSGRQ